MHEIMEFQQSSNSASMATIDENGDNDKDINKESEKESSRKELEDRLTTLLGNVERLSTTESIGRRNVVHRRTQSTHLLSVLDSPTRLRHRVRSSSIAEPPSLLNFAPGSHLLDDFVAETGCLYLSLWLIPPKPLRQELAQEIAKLSLRFTKLKSSAPFFPHITIVGSIKCDTQREATDLGQRLQNGLQGTGPVPCRFRKEPCQSMYLDDENDNHGGGEKEKHHADCEGKSENPRRVVWSQSCIAIMERSEEYMNLLAKSRQALELPPGEWMFPAPAREPHYSKFYSTAPLSVPVDPPPDFVATEAALFLTTPGTVEGVSQWKEITRIPLS
mmetsp:Transcript_28526/g.69406  ORF Transcript_28526/g.69406 Transcript_28526/m.69406 type:complete len:331 (-) Transcript_28526:85-1077(-)